MLPVSPAPVSHGCSPELYEAHAHLEAGVSPLSPGLHMSTMAPVRDLKGLRDHPTTPRGPGRRNNLCRATWLVSGRSGTQGTSLAGPFLDHLPDWSVQPANQLSLRLFFLLLSHLGSQAHLHTMSHTCASHMTAVSPPMGDPATDTETTAQTSAHAVFNNAYTIRKV
jgi:hypothetical protein